MRTPAIQYGGQINETCPYGHTTNAFTAILHVCSGAVRRFPAILRIAVPTPAEHKSVHGIPRGGGGRVRGESKGGGNPKENGITNPVNHGQECPCPRAGTCAFDLSAQRRVGERSRTREGRRPRRPRRAARPRPLPV